MTVLITGANRGIGAALFAAYHSAGVDVQGTARHPEDGGGLLRLDVTQPGAFADLAHALDGQAIDLLVCNSGVYLDKGANLADGYAPELWAQTFAVNVTGVFQTIQTLLPNLQMLDGAKIAIISSVMGSDAKAPGGSYIYRSSKAAVLNVGRNLAADLRGLGIAVGIYHPGWVQTDMGGGAADITAAESAAGLCKRFDALSVETTGCYETYDGTAIPF